MRKQKTEIKLQILDFLLECKEENVSTMMIARAIKSNFPTTKSYLQKISNLELLNKIEVDGHIVGYSLNQELLSLLMASKFSEQCSLDWAKPVKKFTLSKKGVEK